VTLPFEQYLQGIAEVPPTWPIAALEAQAIAARSYALASTGWSGAEGEALPTPICASAACQVYRGIPVPPEPGFSRWVQAVRRSAGEVLLYGGRPADTVYFSTSDGHTYGNDQVFGSAPLPYLRPVVEHDDRASPESHWRVALAYGDLARFLHAAGLWPKGTSMRAVTLQGQAVVVKGPGITRSVDESTFRDAVNTWAPCLEPGRYASLSCKGTPLPVTVPSVWRSFSGGKGVAVVTGRGWGKGVGMVQWGAYGKALRGLSATEILAYYYGGLRPERYPELGLIHVVVASGLRSLTIVPSGPGARLGRRELGTARLHVTGGGHIVVTAG